MFARQRLELAAELASLLSDSALGFVEVNSFKEQLLQICRKIANYMKINTSKYCPKSPNKADDV